MATIGLKGGASSTGTIQINGSDKITIDTAGVVTAGAGTAIAGATNPILALAGSANNYIQSYQVNNTNGVNASSDFACYPNNGSDTSGWIDLGITSQTYAQTAYSVTGANEGYLFMSAPSGSSTSGNLVLATDSTGSTNSIQMFTGGFSQGKTNPAFQIHGVSDLITGINNSTIPTEHYVVLTSTNTLTSQTAAQPIFDGGGGPAGGTITLPVGTYQFECVYSLTGMSGTSASFGFALGGTATKTESWQASAAKGSSLSANSASYLTYNIAANTALASASTGTTGTALIKGIIRVTVAGTIIPQVSLGVAAAAVIQVNSYFKISPISSSATAAYSGLWS